MKVNRVLRCVPSRGMLLIALMVSFVMVEMLIGFVYYVL